jgi:heme-degrading monooxygenase HmoA
MFVLVATAQVKPNSGGAFAQVFEKQLLPSLRAQPGFKAEMLLVVPGGPEIVFVTFWESREKAETYERSAWPESLKLLASLIDDPLVNGFQLAHSTLHEEGVAAFPSQSPITTEPTGPGA